MSATVHQAFRDSAPRRPAFPVHPARNGRGLRHRRRRAGLWRGRRAIETLRAAYARAGYHGHRAGLLLKTARLLPALVRAQRAGRVGGADQSRPARRRTRIPDRPLRNRAGRGPARPPCAAGRRRAPAAKLRVMGPDDAPPAPFAAPLAGSEPGELSECALLPRPAPPAGPRAASCPTAISCTPAAGTRA